MRGVKLQAKHDFDYRGQHYRAGDVFEAAVKDVLVLRYRKKADFAPTHRQTITAALQPERSEPAEPAVSAEPPEPPEPIGSPESDEPRRRRSYRRRDLAPEP